MFGWTQRQIEFVCAGAMVLVLLIGAIFSAFSRSGKDKQGPWTL